MSDPIDDLTRKLLALTGDTDLQSAEDRFQAVRDGFKRDVAAAMQNNSGSPRKELYLSSGSAETRYF